MTDKPVDPTRDRLPCVVPGCRRTRRHEQYAEFICGKHWTLTDRTARQAMFRARRRKRHGAEDWWWDRLKKQAIERAAGL